ncbi:TPA: phage tail protein [Enterobacter bugandensis]
MTVKYKTVITKAGAIKLAAATVPNGKKVNFTAMAIGDGGGTLPVPDASQTKLVNEVWRHTLNKISQDNKHQNYVIAELLIPPETGGFWMREMGLYDDTGTLIAVGNMAESYKPELAEGSGRAQTVRMVIMVSDIESVELTIDTSTVMATQDYVDDKLAEHEQSRRHPDATLTAKGFTQLSSATDSTSETLAATPKAVKTAYDLANGKYTAQDATTAQKGIVQLSSATESVSETLAATPKAVKIAMDNASSRLAKERNLADLPNPALAKQNLKLGAFNTDDNFSSVSAPKGGVFFYITPDGQWGVQDSVGNPLPLAIANGGTEANTLLGARVKLGIASFSGDKTLTTMSSPDGKVYLYIDDKGNWGVQDSAGNPLPLAINNGGTGANTLLGARVKLGIASFGGDETLTTLSSPDGKVYLYIDDKGNWGVQDSVGHPLPLAINNGGTGANTLLGARVQLGVAAFGSDENRSTMSSPGATAFVFVDKNGDWGALDLKGKTIPLPLSRGGLGATDAEGARTALQLGSAATKSVGTGAGQIPDMSTFQFSAAVKGYEKLPSGKIRQWGTISIPAANASTDFSIDSFAIPFPNGVLNCRASGTSTLTDTPCFATAEAISKTEIRLKAIAVSLTNKTITQGMAVNVAWEAIGA